MLPPMIGNVVNKVMEVTDVNGILRQVDVNEVVQRIDWDAVVQRIDWNAVLETIDWDRIVQRVDTNRILAQSSTGLFTTFLDTVRTQLVLMDLWLMVVTRCRFWHRQHQRRCILPPAPGNRQREDRTVYPKGRTNKAVAVQGRYCGFVSKAIAILLDVLCITMLFALLFRMMEWCLVLFLGDSRDEAAQMTKHLQEERNEWMLRLYCVFWFGYFFLSVALAGQTVGMMMVGLKVCNCKRSNPYASVSPVQALIRTFLLPLTLTLFPPLGAIGLVRRDGRMLHDLLANTGVIYLWDAQLAKLRLRALITERSDPDHPMDASEVDEDVSDELDDIMGSQVEGEEEDGFLPLEQPSANQAASFRHYSSIP